MFKKSFIGLIISAFIIFAGASCSASNTQGTENLLNAKYQQYVSNGGQLSYQDWLEIIENPNFNNENYKAPYIGSNGNWFVNELDTGIKAEGVDGESITIQNVTNEEGDDNTTYIKVVFSDGTIIEIPNGKNGIDGYTPYIQDGYWYINGVTTGVSAKGDDVEMRLNGDNIERKTSSSDSRNILLSTDIIKGNDGLDGESAYDIYKKYYNYDGTEEEWVNDLVNGLLHFEDPGIIDYIPPYRLSVCAGEAINLPTRINALYSNGIVEEVNVKWNKTNLDSSYIGVKKVLGYVENYQEKVECYISISNYNLGNKFLDGYVNGIQNNDNVTVTLYNDNIVRTLVPSYDGYFKFDLQYDGTYYIQVDASGYEAVEMDTINIDSVNEDQSNIYSNVKHVNFNLKTLRENGFYSFWSMSDNGSIYQTSSNYQKDILNKVTGNFEEMTLVGAAPELLRSYNVTLLNNGLNWSSLTSSRLYEILERFPKTIFNGVYSAWTLTREQLPDDIEIKEVNDTIYVKISIDAFSDVYHMFGILNDEPQKYYSRRLYLATLKFLTFDNSRCDYVFNEIAEDRYNLSFNTYDYPSDTGEPSYEMGDSFQDFTSIEKTKILTALEETPDKIRKSTKEIKLIRRKNGAYNPIKNNAKVYYWEDSYLEFTGLAFEEYDFDFDIDQIKKDLLVIKFYNLYDYYFSDDVKNEWIKIGEWKEDLNNDWSTEKTNELVSFNDVITTDPRSDMVCNLGIYFTDKEFLKNFSKEKFEFLDTKVANLLYSKLIYPGKVKSTVIKVTGGLNEDKNINIKFKLFGDSEHGNTQEVYLRFLSSDPDNNSYFDIVGGYTDSFGLSLEVNGRMSKYTYSGLREPDFVRFTDFNGNRRYDSPSDIGLKLYVENGLADTEGPVLVENSVDLYLEPNEYPTFESEQTLVIKCTMKDKTGIANAIARIRCEKDNKDSIDVYQNSINDETGEIIFRVNIPSYYSSGTYILDSITVRDLAINTSIFSYDEPDFLLENEKHSIDIFTSNPDDNGPILNVNDIAINARPIYYENPNGDYILNIDLKIKDDISGFSDGYIYVKNSYGESYSNHLYLQMNEAPTNDSEIKEERVYHFSLTVNCNDSSGTLWVTGIKLYDNALNVATYNFDDLAYKVNY